VVPRHFLNATPSAQLPTPLARPVEDPVISGGGDPREPGRRSAGTTSRVPEGGVNSTRTNHHMLTPFPFRIQHARDPERPTVDGFDPPDDTYRERETGSTRLRVET